MMPVISTRYETQSQFGKVEEGRLNESLLFWVRKFPGKFVYHNDITRGCGYTHKWSNAQTITVENLKSKSWTVL